MFRKMVEDQRKYRAIMNGWNRHQNDVVYWEYRAFISCFITTLMHLTTGGANQLLLEDGVTMGDQTFKYEYKRKNL